MLAGDFEVCGGLLDFDAALHEGVDEFGCGGEVGLIGGEDVAAGVAVCGIVEDFFVEVGWCGGCVFECWCCGGASVWLGFGGFGGGFGFEGFDAFGGDGPGVFVAMVDGVLRHAVGVVEEMLALAGGVVEDGAVVGLFVGDGLAEVPELWGDGVREIVGGELPHGDERELHGRGAADDLGENADHVVEVGDGAKAAVVPGGVVGGRAHA